MKIQEVQDRGEFAAVKFEGCPWIKHVRIREQGVPVAREYIDRQLIKWGTEALRDIWHNEGRIGPLPIPLTKVPDGWPL